MYIAFEQLMQNRKENYEYAQELEEFKRELESEQQEQSTSIDSETK